mmetsp:Transcript_77995/g.253048  ORF Transcript_77995/g.253048 Transcript_77995/m.253048 type:complete len:963 (+) Transcript_77995:63-2951(+)
MAGRGRFPYPWPTGGALPTQDGGPVPHRRGRSNRSGTPRGATIGESESSGEVPVLPAFGMQSTASEEPSAAAEEPAATDATGSDAPFVDAADADVASAADDTSDVDAASPVVADDVAESGADGAEYLAAAGADGADDVDIDGARAAGAADDDFAAADVAAAGAAAAADDASVSHALLKSPLRGSSVSRPEGPVSESPGMHGEALGSARASPVTRVETSSVGASSPLEVHVIPTPRRWSSPGQGPRRKRPPGGSEGHPGSKSSRAARCEALASPTTASTGARGSSTGLGEPVPSPDLMLLPLSSTSVSRRRHFSPGQACRRPSGLSWGDSTSDLHDKASPSACAVSSAPVHQQVGCAGAGVRRLSVSEGRIEEERPGAASLAKAGPLEAKARPEVGPHPLLRHCSAWAALLCVVVWVSGLCGGTWIKARSEVAVLRDELHAALDALHDRDAPTLEPVGFLPPGLHWITAVHSGELHDILSKTTTPGAVSTTPPEVFADMPNNGLRSGASLVRHSLEPATAPEMRGGLGHGAQLVELLRSAVPADFPVALLYRVPNKLGRQRQASEGEPPQGAGALPPRRATGEPARPTPRRASAGSVASALGRLGLGGSLKQTLQAVESVHIPLALVAEEKLRSGGRYEEMASPLGDGLRLLAAQEGALEEVRNALRTEVARLTREISIVDRRAADALRRATACSTDGSVDSSELPGNAAGGADASRSSELEDELRQPNLSAAQRTPAAARSASSAPVAAAPSADAAASADDRAGPGSAEVGTTSVGASKVGEARSPQDPRLDKAPRPPPRAPAAKMPPQPPPPPRAKPKAPPRARPAAAAVGGEGPLGDSQASPPMSSTSAEEVLGAVGAAATGSPAGAAGAAAAGTVDGHGRAPDEVAEMFTRAMNTLPPNAAQSAFDAAARHAAVAGSLAASSATEGKGGGRQGGLPHSEPHNSGLDPAPNPPDKLPSGR